MSGTTRGAVLRARIDAKADRTDWQDPTRRTCPPGWVLDREADRRIDGGYSLKRTNLCATCGTYRSRVGTCLCD